MTILGIKARPGKGMPYEARSQPGVNHLFSPIFSTLFKYDFPLTRQKQAQFRTPFRSLCLPTLPSITTSILSADRLESTALCSSRLSSLYLFIWLPFHLCRETAFFKVIDKPAAAKCRDPYLPTLASHMRTG